MLKRLLLNTGSNLVMSLNAMVVTFIMTPIYVANLGHYDYGLREMLMALTGYMGMLDIGMRTTVTRFVSMYNANNDKDALLEVYATSMGFMTLAGLLLATFFWLMAVGWPEKITPDGESTQKYIYFLLLAGVEISFLFPKFVTESYFEGFQYYTLRNAINILFTIALAVTCYLYITPENGLLLLASLVAAQQVLQLFLFAGILALPSLGRIRLERGRFSTEKLRKMLTFGFKSFIQGVSYQVETASDRLVIGSILGPAAVPVYSIPASLLSTFEGIIYTITHSFMPLFSEMDAKNQQDKLRTVYLLSSKYLIAIFIPAAVAIGTVGGPFIEVWMNGEFQRDQLDGIIFLLMLYVMIPKLNPVGSRYLTAIDKHAIYAKVAPVAAFANLIFSILLVFKLGVIGAAMGSVIPVTFIMPIYLRFACKNLQIPVGLYVRKTLFPVFLPAWIMLGFTVVIRYEWGLDNYAEIIGCSVLGGAVYLVAYWILSLQAAERKAVINWVQERYARV